MVVKFALGKREIRVRVRRVFRRCLVGDMGCGVRRDGVWRESSWARDKNRRGQLYVGRDIRGGGLVGCQLATSGLLKDMFIRIRVLLLDRHQSRRRFQRRFRWRFNRLLGWRFQLRWVSYEWIINKCIAWTGTVIQPG